MFIGGYGQCLLESQMKHSQHSAIALLFTTGLYDTIHQSNDSFLNYTEAYLFFLKEKTFALVELDVLTMFKITLLVTIFWSQ